MPDRTAGDGGNAGAGFADVDGDTLPAGFELVEETTRTRLSLPTTTVREHTRLYEDRALRAAVREAGGPDRTWRFFFATGLTFAPPLPPLTGTATAFPSVASEARRGFESDLEDRGIRDVTRRRRERIRVGTGDRASLTPYRGRLGVAPDDGDASNDGGAAAGDLPVAGWLAVWTRDGAFRLAGGGYPEAVPPTPRPLDPEPDPATFREDLLDAVRGVR
jgi:hypothetical protein